MTTAVRLPSDLECIMEEAVASGLQNEDAIEDCALKIEQYRLLFGLGAHPSHKKDCNGISKFIDQAIKEAKPIELNVHFNDLPINTKHVKFDDAPTPKRQEEPKKVVNHKIATFEGKVPTKKFEESTQQKLVERPKVQTQTAFLTRESNFEEVKGPKQAKGPADSDSDD